MYTLKIEQASNQIVKMIQAIVQENRLWDYSIEIDVQSISATVRLSTPSLKELWRLVDTIDSEVSTNEVLPVS
jgi:hypothetical protein